MGVDWEGNLGLGSEAGRRSPYYPGDAGIVMHIQNTDGDTDAFTDENWRAQAFYTSPIADRNCLIAEGKTRDSSACSTTAAADGSGFSAAYRDIPERWMMPGFDDSSWPQAVTFTNNTVGVDNKPAYTYFTNLFDTPDAGAQFILVLQPGAGQSGAAAPHHRIDLPTEMTSSRYRFTRFLMFRSLTIAAVVAIVMHAGTAQGPG